MGTKSRLPLILFLSLIFLASVSLSVGYEDQCEKICKRYFDYDRCLAKCRGREMANQERHCAEEESEERQQQEKQKGEGCPQGRREQGKCHDPEERRPGEKERESKEPRRQEEREQRPEKKEQQQGREGGRSEQQQEGEGYPHGGRGQGKYDDPEERRRQEEREREEGGEGRQKGKNPYYIQSDGFQTRYRTPHGRIRVLPRFDQISHILRGLENYRLVDVEVGPQAFVLPYHSDAHYILVVLKGKGIISIVNRNNRESYIVKAGDVLRIPAGLSTYAANTEDDQNLRMIKLAIPVNTPSEIEDFFPSGNKNPQSYYQGFSREILEIAFNTRFEEIQKTLFGEKSCQQSQQGRNDGVIIRASQKQLRQLSQDAKSIPKGFQSKQGPLNLRNLEPLYANNYGRFYEARPDSKEQPQLQDFDISVALIELQEGALLLPHYNTEATTVAVVVDGEARAEVACPHLSGRSQHQREKGSRSEEQEQEEGSGQIQGLVADLSEGDAMVVPADHPVALRASQNLRIVLFSINVENNQRNFLAGGRDNVINQLDKTAKDLTFCGSTKEVQKLLDNQQESYIVSAKNQGKKEKGSNPLSSILGTFF